MRDLENTKRNYIFVSFRPSGWLKHERLILSNYHTSYGIELFQFLTSYKHLGTLKIVVIEMVCLPKRCRNIYKTSLRYFFLGFF